MRNDLWSNIKLVNLCSHYSKSNRVKHNGIIPFWLALIVSTVKDKRRVYIL